MHRKVPVNKINYRHTNSKGVTSVCAIKTKSPQLDSEMLPFPLDSILQSAHKNQVMGAKPQLYKQLRMFSFISSSITLKNSDDFMVESRNQTAVM